MEKRMFRIAFTGAYDIANYGDHLFPPIFEKEMSRREVPCEITLFSLFEATEPFRGNVPVYPLSKLEEMHLQTPFDAVVVGGGELIHFSSSPQLLREGDTEFQTYNIYATWVVPSLLGLKYGVKVLWNAPGGQYSFSDFYRRYTKLLAAPISYISVRNQSTKNFLTECGIADDTIAVLPDTGFLVSELYSKQELEQRKRSLLDFDGPYAVFHMNRYIEEQDFSAMITAAKALYNKGLKIVCFPFAYTHNDSAVIERFQAAFPDLHVVGLSPKNGYPPLENMISLIAGCELYLGISFHGAVTALAFGKKAVSFDYTGSIKTKDLYSLFGIEQFYVRDKEKVVPAVEAALTQSYPDCSALCDKIISNHFDRLAQEILQTGQQPAAPGRYPICSEEYFEFINLLTKYYLNSSYDIMIMQKQIKEKDAVMMGLYRDLEAAQEYIKKIEGDIAALSQAGNNARRGKRRFIR